MTVEQFRAGGFQYGDYCALSQWARGRYLWAQLRRPGYCARHGVLVLRWWHWQWGIDTAQTWEQIGLGPITLEWHWE